MSFSNQPLAGLTVLALEQAVAAPYCSSRLADAGARVIKIEREDGDFARTYDESVEGLSSYFVWLNRGKESLVADIKKPQDIRLLQNILEKSDIFIQNLAPGAAARAGLGSDILRRRYPRLTTVDITGYGLGNPFSDMKAYDLLVQAESGLASITGSPDSPGRVGISVCDIACGMAAYTAVLEAVVQRSRTGRGSAIELSLFGVIADWMNVPLLYYEGTGKVPQRIGLAHPTLCPYGTFKTRDGESVVISIQNDREWVSFCKHVLQDVSLAKQDGFQSNSARVGNRANVDMRVGRIFQTLTKNEAIDRLRVAGTAYGFINGISDLGNHPALVRTTIETPNGQVSIVPPPALVDGGTRRLGRVPALGEHTSRIRTEFEQ